MISSPKELNIFYYYITLSVLVNRLFTKNGEFCVGAMINQTPTHPLTISPVYSYPIPQTPSRLPAMLERALDTFGYIDSSHLEYGGLKPVIEALSPI